MWDYSEIADFYDARPKYSEVAVDVLASLEPEYICDVGAGTGILTQQLCDRGLKVLAIEPNANMRRIGQAKTACDWRTGTGEETGCESAIFDLVTFGSSFNVCDQAKALAEAKRIMKPQGRVACLWNHRDLTNDLQVSIEQVIHDVIPTYEYGSRRQDQSVYFDAAGMQSFYFEFSFEFLFDKQSFMQAWKSHLTLQRQAGEQFSYLLGKIEDIVPDKFVVPYKTVMWIAHE